MNQKKHGIFVTKSHLSILTKNSEEGFCLSRISGEKKEDFYYTPGKNFERENRTIWNVNENDTLYIVTSIGVRCRLWLRPDNAFYRMGLNPDEWQPLGNNHLSIKNQLYFIDTKEACTLELQINKLPDKLRDRLTGSGCSFDFALLTSSRGAERPWVSGGGGGKAGSLNVSTG